MLRNKSAARAASVLSAAIVPLLGGCLSVPPPPPGGYVQVTATRAAPAPVTPSGEAEPTPDPVVEATPPAATEKVSLPEDPALTDDHFADLEFGDTTTGGAQLPPQAKVMNGGHGNLYFKATEQGRVFVFDTESRVVLLSARVREGQAVEVRSGRGSVTIDGEEQVLQTAMDRRHRHQVLFAEFRGFGWARDGRPGSRGASPLRDSLERAQVVARGRGWISHYATSRGVLYVRDLTSGKIVRALPIAGRARLTLSPDRDQLKASNGKVWAMELDRTHAHALLWDTKGEEMYAWLLRREAMAGAQD
jgi:hypothetical protein